MAVNLSFIKKSLCVLLAAFSAQLSAKENIPNVELSSSLLFQIIASEFALQRNEPATAFQTYLQTARTTKDPRLAKRAFEIADGVHAFDQAAQAAKLWVSLSPSSSDAQLADLLAQLRQGALSDENQKKAKKLLTEATDENEKLKRFQAIVIQTELSGTQPDKVLLFIRPLAQICKDRKEAALTLAKLYRRTGNEQLGQQYAKAAWQQMPESTVALLEYADTLIEKKPNEAIRILERFVGKHPKDYDAQLGLAKAYARTQNQKGVQKQIALLDPFAQKLPNIAFTLATVSDSVGLLDETKRYLMTFERLAKEQQVLLERLPRTYLSLGMIDYKQQHFDAAAEWFKQVDADSEFFPQARLFLAQCFATQKKFDEAIETLEKTKVDSRLKPEFLYKKALLFREAGNTQKAYQTMKEALATDSENRALLFQCAILANDLKRIDEAETYLRKAIDLYPDEADFYNTLGYLWVDNNMKLKEAKSFIQKALDMEPNNAAYLDSMGWLYFREGNLEQAKLYLEKANSILKDKEVSLHLAEVYQAMGLTNKAMDILRPMLKESPNDPVLESFMDRLHLRF